MDLSSFRASLRRFAKKTLPEAVERKVDALGAELLQRVKEKTPIDTGTAREAWTLTKEGEGFRRKATLSNPLPYVKELEQGSSNQAPLGMVAVSIEEMKAGAK